MTLSIGQILQQSFLEGERINVTEYARRREINVEAMRHAIRSFQKIGAIEPKTTRKHGQESKYWIVANEGILADWRPNKGTQNVAIFEFTGLLDAWGIRVANIDLPSFVHRMKTAADDKEE